MGTTLIEWTRRTWNPMRGCQRVSEGCRNCYAEKMAGRFCGKGQPYEGFVTRTKRGPRWTCLGFLMEHILREPLGWRTPQTCFVNSMSDTFFEQFSFEEIAAVFGVMAACPQHTFQVLTKRPQRMLDFFEWLKEAALREGEEEHQLCIDAAEWEMWGGECGEGRKDWRKLNAARVEGSWPLPNVWIGVSVENQDTADERIPLLLKTPAARRFLSVEPLIGLVDLSRWINGVCPCCWSESYGHEEDVEMSCQRCGEDPGSVDIDWVIVGGESGNKARPMHPEWARSIRNQCQRKSTPPLTFKQPVPFFFKQWGRWALVNNPFEEGVPGMSGMRMDGRWIQPHECHDPAVGDVFVAPLGKKKSGRVLDGKIWDEMPPISGLEVAGESSK